MSNVGLGWKDKIFIKLPAPLESNYRTSGRKQPTINGSLKSTQCARIKRSNWVVILHTVCAGRQKTFWDAKCLTDLTVKLKRMSFDSSLSSFYTLTGRCEFTIQTRLRTALSYVQHILSNNTATAIQRQIPIEYKAKHLHTPEAHGADAGKSPQIGDQYSRMSRVNAESKRKVFYGQELPRGESSTTVCGANYQRLAVMLLK